MELIQIQNTKLVIRLKKFLHCANKLKLHIDIIENSIFCNFSNHINWEF